MSDLSGDQARRLLSLALELRKAASKVGTTPTLVRSVKEPEEWLSMDEVVRLTGLSRRQVFDLAKTPAWKAFSRPVSRKTVKFAKLGFLRWQERQGDNLSGRRDQPRQLYDSSRRQF